MRCARRVALALSVAVPLAAQTPRDPTARLDAAVLQAARAHFVGAVLVERGGHVLLRRGYGAADRREVPATPATLFDVASVSKQFTAAAILRLEADGRLTTRDPLLRFFDRLPEDKAAIRLHELLTHTSGLPTDIESTAAERADRDLWLAHVWRTPLVGAPGERFVYSNTGYGVLAAVVERAAHAPFEAWTRRHVFARAGLRDTGFVGDPELDASRAAMRWQHPGDETRGETAVAWPWHWSFKGATGVVTTVDDLFAWNRALDGDLVLPAVQRDKLLRPLRAGYSYGWEVEDTRRGTRRQAHRGVTYGFQSWCARYPDEDAFVAVLCNHACALGPLSDELERILFEAGAPGAALEAATGTWRTPDGDVLVVTAQDGGLCVVASGPELAPRARYGRTDPGTAPLETLAFARHAARTVEDAGRRGRKTAFSPDADDAAVERTGLAWRALEREHGTFRAVAVLVTAESESWLRVTFSRTATVWRARWAPDRALLALEPDTGAPPLPRLGLAWRRDLTFEGPSADGRATITLRFGDGTATWLDDEATARPLALARER